MRDQADKRLFQIRWVATVARHPAGRLTYVVYCITHTTGSHAGSGSCAGRGGVLETGGRGAKATGDDGSSCVFSASTARSEGRLGQQWEVPQLLEVPACSLVAATLP